MFVVSWAELDKKHNELQRRLAERREKRNRQRIEFGEQPSRFREKENTMKIVDENYSSSRSKKMTIDDELR